MSSPKSIRHRSMFDRRNIPCRPCIIPGIRHQASPPLIKKKTTQAPSSFSRHRHFPVPAFRVPVSPALHTRPPHLRDRLGSTAPSAAKCFQRRPIGCPRRTQRQLRLVPAAAYAFVMQGRRRVHTHMYVSFVFFSSGTRLHSFSVVLFFFFRLRKRDNCQDDTGITCSLCNTIPTTTN